MPGKQPEFVLRPQHRFDQARRLDRLPEEIELEQALPVFGVFLRVRDDASADADLALAVFANDGGADRDIEGKGAVRRDMADGTGIKPAWSVLDFVDDLHRADFRR